MNMSNINLATEWFEVLQTTERSRTAVMRLDPGQSTGEHAESHDKSEQLLLLLEGRLMAEIGKCGRPLRLHASSAPGHFAFFATFITNPAVQKTSGAIGFSDDSRATDSKRSMPRRSRSASTGYCDEWIVRGGIGTSFHWPEVHSRQSAYNLQMA
jgi:hypothetical protein